MVCRRESKADGNVESEVEDTTVSKAIVVGHGAVNGMSVEASSSLSQLSSSGQT